MGPLCTASDIERRLYTHLFQVLPIPALILTVEGVTLSANAEGARLLGVSDPAALRGRSFGDWIAAPQRAAMDAALRNAVHLPQDVQVIIEVAGEGARDVKAAVVSVDAEGRSPKLLLLAVDVSRELLLQRKLMQADRLSQLGVLVAGVAHELNNPLAAIAAFAETLAAEAGTPDLRESAEVIRVEAMRAGRIVGTLLDFARQRPRVSTAVDLVDVVQRALYLQRSALKRAQVRVALAMADDLPAVVGDPQEVQQIVLNAIVNARQAIEGTGRPGQVLIATQRTDHHVVVTVEDTGPGVPLAILDRVFEPFFTTRGEHGTGLGLAISFGLVRAMGGRIWIQNIEGGGARLAFELPIDTTHAGAGAGTEVRAPARRLAVLVVDDEDNVRRGMVLLARRLGHTVESIGRFAEAARRLGDPAATSYDVLLVDVHLDEGRSGIELFDQLSVAGEGRERRIVFTSGDSISTLTRDRLQRTDQPVLRKPFGLQELSEMLDRVATESD